MGDFTKKKRTEVLRSKWEPPVQNVRVRTYAYHKQNCLAMYYEIH